MGCSCVWEVVRLCRRWSHRIEQSPARRSMVPMVDVHRTKEDGRWVMTKDAGGTKRSDPRDQLLDQSELLRNLAVRDAKDLH